MRLLRKLRAFFRREKLDAEMSEELRAHLELQARENIARGMPPGDARCAALREFGGVEQIKERCRDQRGWLWLEHAAGDFCHGVRAALRRDRGFAILMVLLMALGIGANTAVFSLVYSVLWQPLPYTEPERLVALWSNEPKISAPRYPVAPADYRDWREQNTVFEDIALAFDIGNLNLTGSGEPERLSAALISPNLLPVLGVNPILGRGFAAGEDASGRSNVVLLGHAFWQRRFAGDPAIVGRTVQLSGTPRTVIGVLPQTFAYPGGAFDVWVPLTINPDEFRTRSGSRFHAVARLKPGVTLAHAQAEMETISRRLARAFPATNEDRHVTIEPLRGDLVRTTRLPLLALLGAVGCLLLIACANLANLFFARALARQRELQVRAALGATRGRMVRQLIAEMLPLLAAACGLGWLLAQWGLAAAVAWLSPEFPRLGEVGLHWPAAAFATGLLGLVAVVAILWPAVAVSGGDLFANLRSQQDFASGGRRRVRLRDGLLVAEVALTALLVAGALLLTRTFVALRSVDLGFQTESVLSLRLAIPRAKYRADADVAAFCDRVLERVRTLPGVTAAGAINRLPLGGTTESWGVDVERASGEINRLATANVCLVTPGYLRALGIPLLRGREIIAADQAASPPIALVDERIAQRFWPGENAVGRRFRLDVAGVGWIEIVGVVGHVRMESVDSDPRPQIYLPFAQWPRDRVALVVRTFGKSAAVASPAVLGAIRAIDPEQPAFAVQEMGDVIGNSLAERRLATALAGTFATASLALAFVGIYGVFAFMVNQRTREFGVRLALGAARGDILRLVLRRAVLLAGVGAAAGLAVALAGAQMLRVVLFGISPLDPVSFGAAALLLIAVALLACWLPARRAAKVDPMVALRAE